MDTKLTSIDCLLYWIKYKLKMFGIVGIWSHEIQLEAPTWIKQHYDMLFNPATMDRSWRRAQEYGRLRVEEIETNSAETLWRVLEIDGQDGHRMARSDFPQPELF